MKKVERFNKDNLRILITITSDENIEMKQLNQDLLFYYSCSEFSSGFCEITYHFGKEAQNVGRLYGYSHSQYSDLEKHICLQTFPRWVRAALAEKYYMDLDIENCHATLLLGWTNVLNFSSDKTSNLRKFCTNRDLIRCKLEEVLSLELAEQTNIQKLVKSFFPVIIFGGSFKTWYEENIRIDDKIESIFNKMNDALATFNIGIQDLQEELENIGFALFQDIQLCENPNSWHLFARNVYNYTSKKKEAGSRDDVFHFMSLLLQETERLVLAEIDMKLNHSDINAPMDSVIHDGGLVRKKMILKSEKCVKQWDSSFYVIDEDILMYEKISNCDLSLALANHPACLSLKISKEMGIDINCKLRELDLSYFEDLLKKFSANQPISYKGFPYYSYKELKHFHEQGHLSFITKKNKFVYEGKLFTKEEIRNRLGSVFFMDEKDGKPKSFIEKYFQDPEKETYYDLQFILKEGNFQKDDAMDLLSSRQICPRIKVIFNGKFPILQEEIHSTRLITTFWPEFVPTCILVDNFGDWNIKKEDLPSDLGLSKIFSQEKFDTLKRQHSNLADLSHQIIFPIISHLYRLIDRNEEVLIYILKWFAQIALFPDKKIGGCGLIFSSEREGTGKSIFINWVLEVFAPLSKTISDGNMIFGQFTSILEHCVLLHLEDPSKKHLKNNHGLLKALITSKQTRIEKKGYDSYLADGFARWIISSNTVNCLGLDDKDRRWGEVQCHNEFLGNYEYFSKFAQFISSLKVKQAFLLFLLSLKINSDWNGETERPEILNARKKKRIVPYDWPEFLSKKIKFGPELEDFSTSKYPLLTQNSCSTESGNRLQDEEHMETYSINSNNSSKFKLNRDANLGKILPIFKVFLSSFAFQMQNLVLPVQKIWFLEENGMIYLSKAFVLKVLRIWMEEYLKDDKESLTYFCDKKGISAQDLAYLYRMVDPTLDLNKRSGRNIRCVPLRPEWASNENDEALKILSLCIDSQTDDF